MHQNIIFFIFFFFAANLLTAQFQPIPFEDDFESNTIGPGWVPHPSLQGQANGVIEVVTRPYAGGQFGLRIGKASDGEFTLNALDLYLDLGDPNLTEVFLEFSIMSIFDETHLQDGLWFSNDGGLTFEKVYDFKPGLWCGGVYGEFPPFNVSRLAQAAGLPLSSAFVIRWQQYGNDDFSGGSASVADGLYLDNVKVYASGLAYAALPFEDDFETGALGSSWKVGFAQATSLPAEDVDSPMGAVELLTSGNNAQVRLGKHCDQGQDMLTANALDLHLDLGDPNLTEVFLEFSIMSIFDETHLQDGLWFSNDGGLTFEKVYDFKPGLWCGGVYGEFPPFNVSRLAQAAGLPLSSAFVIRWQQYGNDDFSGGSASVADGLYLDNVKVYASGLAYAALPFEDDFETGALGSSWKVGFAQATSLPAEDVDSPMGFIGIENAGSQSQYSVRLAKRCDQSMLTSNALDLHLNLENADSVVLEFEIFKNNDELNFQDGLYLSNDGGESFTGRVFEFNFDDLPNKTFTRLALGLDSLATEAGIAYTSQFVVRFQQIGFDDFVGGTSTSEDGIRIDNVRVVKSLVNSSVSPGRNIKRIELFPNPANNFLQIKGDFLFNRHPSQIQIFDSLGRIVLHENGYLTEAVNIANLPAGLYVVFISNGAERYSGRFLKN